MRERRAHSDRCGFLPPDLPADAHPYDRSKRQGAGSVGTVSHLQLATCPARSLRPPAKDIGVKTSGRKSKLGGERYRENLAKVKPRKRIPTQVEEDGAEADTEPAVKLNPKSLSKAERAIAKSKEVAKRLGRVYTGPGADIGGDEGIELAAAEPKFGEEGYVKTSEEVLRDMHTEAEWVRAELAAGRERRPFGTEPGAAVDGEEDGDNVDEDGNPIEGADVKPKPKPAKGRKKAAVKEEAAEEAAVKLEKVRQH